MYRAGLFFLGQPIRLTHPRGDVVTGHDLHGILRDRAHHVDHIQDLEAALLGFLDRFLAGHHQHRHTTQLRVRGGGDEIGGARSQSGKAHAGVSGQTAVDGGHESGTLLMPGQDELDLLRPRQGVEEVQVLLTGDPEHVLAAFFFETLDKQVGRFHGLSFHRW